MFGLVNKEPSNDVKVPQLKQVSPNDFPRAIYVAAASREIDRAEAVMAQLRANGMLVTSTWVDVIRKVGDANLMTADRDQRAMWSAVDLHEVSQSSIFLYLLPPKGVYTDGAPVEFGYILAMQAFVEQMRSQGAPIPSEADRWIIVAGTERSIFTALADHYETDDAAVKTILKNVLNVE
jgi:hypothetical protein